MSKPQALIFRLLAVLFTIAVLAPETTAQDPPRGPAKGLSGAAGAVTVRIGKHPGFMRIVLEATEEQVQNASVMFSGESAVKVVFPSPVAFRVVQKGASQKTLPPGSKIPHEAEKGVRITAGGTYCVIVIDGLDDISVSKFSAPSRLVIDAYTVQAAPPPAPSAPAAPAERPAGERMVESAAGVIEALDIPYSSFVIDAGHGGLDSGMQFGKAAEKDIALSFARDLAAVLGKKAKKVSLTRKGDQVMTIRERVRIAQQKAPELLISFHVASGNELVVYTAAKRAGGQAGGVQKRLLTAEGDPAAAFARALVQSVRSECKVEARHERLPLPLLTHTAAPALLVELPSPERFSYDGKNKARLIKAILHGIAAVPMNQSQG
ncbi:MAG: N-acetylmuramoyl-L-alanine amidase [Nitrospirota bacterium]